MTDLIIEWLQSAQFIAIGDIDLMPLATEESPSAPLALKSRRAEVYFMRGSNDQLWVIKKFLSHHADQTLYRDSIKTLIPHRPGFEAGYLRKVLHQESISNPIFRKPPLSTWIENTILMPAVSGSSWAAVSRNIREGRQYLPKKHRIKLIRSLSEKVQWLEGQDISHRDLSAANVCVDIKEADVHLVDWDAMFHPTLAMPEALTRGTRGYIAPFLNIKGVSDGRHTWRVRADRFSLALLNAEILTISEGFPSTGETGMCDQDDLYNRSGPCLDAMIADLKLNFPRAAALLEQALAASSFDDCPAPADWVMSMGLEPVIRPQAIPVRDRPAFAGLNRSGFTRLNQSVFVKLRRHAFAQPPYRIKTL